MPLLSLPWLELSRFRRSLITKLALVVIIVIPCLYGGLYLTANWNPTANLSKLQAAVVNQDSAATTTGADGTTSTVDAGQQIVDQVTGSDAAGFTWHEVSAAQAAKGLSDGDYAAVMTIPAGFSDDLVSVGGSDPQKAQLSVVTDDADNYIVGNIANSLTTTLRDKLAATTTATSLANVYVGFNSIHTSISQAADGAGTLADGARSADDGAQQLSTGLVQLSTGAGSLASGTQELATGAQDAADGAAKLSTGLGQLESGTAALPQQTRQLASGAAAVATGSRQVADGTAAVASAADAVDDATAALNGVPGQLREASTRLQTTTDSLGQARSDLEDKVLTAAQAVAAAHPDDPDAQALVAQVTQLQSQLSPGLDQVGADLEQAASTLDQRAGQLDGAGTRLDQARSSLDQLATGASQVADGASQVSTGAGRLADASGTLAGGIASAADGSSALASGTAQLASGAERLNTGAQQLATGTASASGGATQLADGTTQLADGSTQLADGLRSGADSIPTYSDADRATRSQVGAAPVASTFTRENAVGAYGEGLAPYFLALSLWIGGMISYMVLRAVSPRALAATASSWRAGLSGYLPGAGFAILQAVGLLATVHLLLDFSAASPWATTAFAVLIALVFTAIHQCFNALLGGIGRLVALVLLMLQLASAGGTYPVATTNAFFEAIAPYLPMAYAVGGLRRLIAEGWTTQVWGDVVGLLIAGLVAISITLFACHRRRTWTVAKLHPSLSL